MDEIYSTVRFSFNDVSVYACVFMMHQPIFGFTSEINALKSTALAKFAKGFILQMMGKCRAVIFGREDCYSLFNSHAFDEFGFPASNTQRIFYISTAVIF